MAIVDSTRELEPRERAPIGWEGRTAKEMLEESERRFAQSGAYWGLDGDLELKGADPIRYEKLFSRVRGGLVSARETALNISASPIVKEIGELCFALYTPEGDSVALSTGIIVHVHTMSDAIKHMVRSAYEDNPRIEPGDIFTNNDAMIGDVHNADVQTIVPIFFEGELVGWAGGVTHEIDIGAKTPGGVPVGPISRFEDGIDLPAKKIGSHDELWRDHVEAGKKGTRTPMYWTLDERTRLAGCHMVREAVERVILEEGVDVYKRFVREVIEDGRRAFKSRLREMTVPGRYRAPAFIELPFAKEAQLPSYARVDHALHAAVELRITRDAVLELDYDGTSAWGHHSGNCTPSSMQGAIWVMLTQTLICNDKVNDGAYLGLRANFPPGTLSNHSNPNASTGNAWYFLIPSFMGFIKSLSRSLQARGFVEEVLAPYGLTANAFQGGGITQYGTPGATTNFGLSCVGGGAKMLLDGLDYGAAMWNPEGDMGDMEMWELIEPFLYLGQRVKPNTAGPGRHRGGSGYECLRLAWKTPFFEMQNIGNGRMFMQSGLWGGYPAAPAYRHNIRDTDFFAVVERGEPYPVHEPDPADSALERVISGTRQFDLETTTLPEMMRQGDLYLSVLRGGAGLGDPLERPYESVMEDIDGDFLLARYAEPVYGVVPGDPDATEVARAAARDRRGDEAVPVREWMAAERERVLAGDFIEPVRRMYAESLRLSQRWAAEFREFWDLPEDFDYEIETPEVDIAKALIAQAGATA
ncbi:MAG: N-methylhydantoinase [Solirubrobacteraceae bacterium]|jgi:N-methylhydantoinase B/acetone carboxylase alpha subunit|nr:N-methylhydantoinase [Solirubrobacteraceae bacterium]